MQNIGAYSREDVALMREALEAACKALSFAYPQGVDKQVRRQLACSISADLANGELRPNELCGAALRNLPPAVATYPAARHFQGNESDPPPAS